MYFDLYLVCLDKPDASGVWLDEQIGRRGRHAGDSWAEATCRGWTGSGALLFRCITYTREDCGMYAYLW